MSTTSVPRSTVLSGAPGGQVAEGGAEGGQGADRAGQGGDEVGAEQGEGEQADGCGADEQDLVADHAVGGVLVDRLATDPHHPGAAGHELGDQLAPDVAHEGEGPDDAEAAADGPRHGPDAHQHDQQELGACVPQAPVGHPVAGGRHRRGGREGGGPDGVVGAVAVVGGEAEHDGGAEDQAEVRPQLGRPQRRDLPAPQRLPGQRDAEPAEQHAGHAQPLDEGGVEMGEGPVVVGEASGGDGGQRVGGGVEGPHAPGQEQRRAHHREAHVEPEVGAQQPPDVGREQVGGHRRGALTPRGWGPPTPRKGSTATIVARAKKPPSHWLVARQNSTPRSTDSRSSKVVRAVVDSPAVDSNTASSGSVMAPVAR